MFQLRITPNYYNPQRNSSYFDFDDINDVCNFITTYHTHEAENGGVGTEFEIKVLPDDED